MGDAGRLQKAVEKTIAAGYQMDREAFEFLAAIAATDDPDVIVTKVLEHIENLEEKPMFLGKDFFESAAAPSAETVPPCPAIISSKIETQKLEPVEQPKSYPQASSPFKPWAKNVEPQLEVLEDPTEKITCNGTIEEFQQYFHDRFKRMEKLLRQRMDVKAATPISEALKSQPKAKLKIIGMVTEKRDAKQQLLITIEDLTASATLLVQTKAPEEVQRKAQMLLSDQVICVAVSKTRGRLFLVEDIIFPEVGQKPPRRASEPVYAVLTSDIHIGSNKFCLDPFKRFLHWLNGTYGDERMRQIASHVKYLLVAGDLVDGVGVFPGQALELNIRDVHKQYRMVASAFAKIPEHIEIVISPGNHDAPRKALPQPAISEDYFPTLQGNRRIYSLGNPCNVSLHGIEVLMYHGRSLDDILGSVPGVEQAHPEKGMKLLMQGRHLAPMYGAKTTLSPESRDFLVVDHVPDIFHAGHVHVLGMLNYRGVLILNSGGWQYQTDYMAKLGLVPTPGKVPVVNLQTMETTVLDFN